MKITQLSLLLNAYIISSVSCVNFQSSSSVRSENLLHNIFKTYAVVVNGHLCPK
jgi:hypothetical protein